MSPVPENNRPVRLDYQTLFEAAPGSVLVVLPDDPVFTIVAVTEAYLRLLKVRREEILGRGLFEVFPDNPDLPSAGGTQNLRAFLRRVLASRAPDQIPVQRYDTGRPATEGGGFEERYWNIRNQPILDATGEVIYLLNAVEEVTEQVQATERARVAQQELHTSETRFRQLAEGTPLGLLLGGWDGPIFYFNPTARKLLGYTEEEIAAGRVRWNQLTPPEVAALDVEAVRQLTATGQCAPYESVYLTKDSQRVPVLVGASLLETGSGGREVAAFLLDRTEQKRLEWRDAFLVRLDDATRPLMHPDEITQTAVRLLGEYLQADSVVYCHFAADEETFDTTGEYTTPGVPSLLGHFQTSQFGTAVAQSFRTRQPYVVEDIEKDPRTADVRAMYRQAGIGGVLAVPLQKAGRLVAALGVHQRTPRRWRLHEVELVQQVANRCWESLERAQVTRQLQISEQRLRLAQRAGRIGSFEWLIPEGVVIWTPELEALYGVPESRFEGGFEDWSKRVAPGDAERVTAGIAACLAQRQAEYSYEFQAILPDGTRRWLRGQAQFFYDEMGKPIRMLGVNIDIDSQKEAEVERERLLIELTTNNQELQKANRELEEFAYVASHDLQEPLRMVSIYTQLLLRRVLSGDHEAEQHAGVVRQGVNRMNELIRDLLSYSRTLHAEEQPGDAVNLSQVLARTLSLLQGRIEETKAVITSEPLPVVSGDTTQLTLVFQHLLSNSLQYCRPGVPPTIHLAATQQNNEWVISVQDNGIGFDPQYAERIFGLFKRLHKDEYPGTGLGLALCRRILERTGGRIWAEGRPRAGATFFIALPAGKEQ